MKKKLHFCSYLKSNRGGIVIEFIFCTPVVCLFLYGLIHINSYFDKEQRILIVSRSMGFSSNQNQIQTVYQKDIDFKADTQLDESRFFEDKLTYKQEKSSTVISDAKSYLDDFSLSRVITEFIKGFDNRMEHTVVESRRKNNEEYKDSVEFVAEKTLKLDQTNPKLADPMVLTHNVFSVLDTGFLDNDTYNRLAVLYWALGLTSKWGSDYVDKCMMVFKPYTSCNGVNSLWVTISAIASAKAVGEVFSLGTIAITEDVISVFAEEIIDMILESAIGKISDYLENSVFGDSYSNKS